MRRLVFVASLFSVAVLSPQLVAGQVYQLPTPTPPVSAASAPWQLAGEPVFHAGVFYYPAGATVFFDGHVMQRTGTYRDVPVYEDSTVEPFSMVYLPIGRNLMRPYERRREGPLAGTVGSRAPSFPVQRDIELSAGDGTGANQTSMFVGDVPGDTYRTVDAGGEGAFRPSSSSAASAVAGPTGVQSIPPPRSPDGVWIMFEDARWYLDGQAVSFDAARFSPVGNYRGFPVYRETSGDGARIFVTVLPNGPVAPFVRR
jgi:hypothetical protein